jgi:hypothetical protein
MAMTKKLADLCIKLVIFDIHIDISGRLVEKKIRKKSFFGPG